jgi:hypothetical protein
MSAAPLFFLYIFDPSLLILRNIFILSFLFFGFNFLYAFSFWGVFVVVRLERGRWDWASLVIL